MPTRNRNSLRIRRKNDDWEYETAEEDAAVRTMPLGSQTGRRRGPKARLALVAAFTSLFFAGAAFTAGAGDQLSRMLEPDDAAALQAGLADAAAVAAEAPAATVESAPAAPETAPVVAPEATPEAAPAAPESAPAAVESAPTGRCRRRNGRCSRDANGSRGGAERSRRLHPGRQERRELTYRSVGRRRAQGTGGEARGRQGQDTHQEMGREAGRSRARELQKSSMPTRPDSESRPSGSTGHCRIQRRHPPG